MIGGMSDLVIPDFDPEPLCHDCHWELTECACLPEPPEIRCSIRTRASNAKEVT